ncbi:hypothetical protein CDQ91_10425 [Sphingopyxis witflariensis]|uniref:Uncharacterized protein n=2 Tax=Sphingopyxis witflariensis TaxID=173675 RepID=A0A246JZR7_9SPHN|nr:hypothetical protein CDQ91_10425 [Sphingopyxis witflariensis]
MTERRNGWGEMMRDAVAPASILISVFTLYMTLADKTSDDAKWRQQIESQISALEKDSGASDTLHQSQIRFMNGSTNRINFLCQTLAGGRGICTMMPE